MVQENPDTMSFLPGTGPPIIPHQGRAPVVSLAPFCDGGSSATTSTCDSKDQETAPASSSSHHRLGHIMVHDRKLVEKSVIPRYFNHSSFASLRRQLNYFNFERVGRGRQKGATYRNDGMVVLEDILRLKRRPNVNPGESGEKGLDGAAVSVSAPNDSSAAGVASKENMAPNATEKTAQYEIVASSTLLQAQAMAQSSQALVPQAQAQDEAPAFVHAPHMQGQMTLPLQGYAPATLYALPNGTFGYAQPAQMLANHLPVATVYYAPAQMPMPLQGSIAAPLSRVTQPPQGLVPATAPTESIQMQLQILPQAAAGAALAPTHYSLACMKTSSPLVPAARVVSQSDMSTVSAADPSQAAPAVTTVPSAPAPQAPVRSAPPQILLKKRPYYGTMFAKHSEEQESENKNKRVKQEVTHDSSACSAPASAYCYNTPAFKSPCNPSHSHAVLYGVPPPAVPVSPNLQEDNYNQQQQQPQQPGYYHYSLPQHPTSANLDARAQALVVPRSTAPPPQHQTVIATTQERTIIPASSPSSYALAPHVGVTNELSTVSPVTKSRSISDEVLYETKDGFPLKREDLLLCAALIHLGGSP
jgi:hypothetical protein